MTLTKEMYKEKMKEIQAEAQKKLNQLARNFADANNPVKVDDIVTDHIGALKVKKIKYYFSLSTAAPLPQCYYSGTRLTKAGNPAKREDADVYQQNLIKINDKLIERKK